MAADQPRPFTDHLEEIRRRLLKALILVLGISFVLFGYAGEIIAFLLAPLGSGNEALGAEGRIVFNAPIEAFMTHFAVALYGGILLASPFVLYQIWAFTAVALTQKEKRYVLTFLPLSVILFAGGAAFGYFLIVPLGLKFLLGYGGKQMVACIC